MVGNSARYCGVTKMTLDLDDVLTAYLEAVEFTDFGEDDQPERGSEFAPDTLSEALTDCLEFIETTANHGLLDEYIAKGGTAEQFGHDLWLTRNRHGVGFWDRGLGGLGEQLTHHAHAMGETYAYTGDDGLVYLG